MKRYFNALMIPLAATVANALLRPLLCAVLPGQGGNIVFNLLRFAIWGYAGWRMSAIAGFSVAKSALSGAILLFVDHPIITGGWFLIRGWYMAAGGVLVSYLMFCLVPVLIAGIGAATGQAKQKNKALPYSGSSADRKK